MYLIKFTLIISISFLVACSATPLSPPKNQFSPVATIFHSANMWTTLSYQCHLPDETPFNPEVRKQIDWYMKRKHYLEQIAERSKPYLYYIYQEVKKRGLPVELTLLPMVESAYDPFAYSHVGAAGLWQIMPGTASGFGLKVNWWYDGRRDIVASTNSALEYLSYLGNYFNNNWLLALAAYDTGEGTVVAAMQRNIKQGKRTDFWNLPLPQEARDYVPKLLALATIIKHPLKYPVNWPSVLNSPYFVQVNVGSQIDLAHAAKMADIGLEELSKLNAGFNHWITDPKGKHQLLLPIEKVAHFQEELDRFSKQDHVNLIRYTVEKGDTLSALSHQFNTTVFAIKKTNHLKNDTLHLKQILFISKGTTQPASFALHTKQNYLDAISQQIPTIHIINYTVKKGDTLSSIANHYQVTQKEIRFWNRLDNKKKLQLGQTLSIWPSHKNLRKTSIKLISYKVKSGDTLGQIASYHQTNTKKLRKINHLEGDLLKPGQILKVPDLAKIHHQTTKTPIQAKTHSQTKKLYTPQRIRNTTQLKQITYQVKSGDTLSKIAKTYHVTVADLKRWNQIIHTNLLKTHQSLVLYIRA
jgi:membrane-bound lytic murein transglycosylase D